MKFTVVRQGRFKDYHDIEADSREEAARQVAVGEVEHMGESASGQTFYADLETGTRYVLGTIAVTEAS